MTIALIILMLVLSGFFSGSEIAFVAANRLKAEARSAGGGPIASSVRFFLRSPGTFLSATLVGNNLALVIYSTVMALYLEHPVRELIQPVIPTEATGEVAVILIQTIVASFFVLVFGEIVPKSILYRIADRAIFLFAVPLRVAYYLLLPLIKLTGWSATGLMKLIGAETAAPGRLLRREVEITIRESRRRGELDLDEERSALLANVFRISKLRVKESMVPRTDIEGVEHTASIAEVAERFGSTGYSKLPVYEDNVDNIVGVVFAYDLFTGPTTLDEMIRPVRFVPETKRSKDLLKEFLEDNFSIAVVIDEYGGTAGLVTIEDVIEELTGEIQDEFDTDDFLTRQVDDRTFITSGRTELAELKDSFGIRLSEGDFETVAGLLLEHFGYIPGSNEECVIDGFRFVILKAVVNRIDLVKIITPGS
jgi:CBS domain containing-hemolysin-like protein